jgi:hypothetical protein
MVAGHVAETQLQLASTTSISMFDDLPPEVEDSQTQTQQRQSAFRPGKENGPPVNNAPTPSQTATRSAHFQTPKAKDKRAALSHESTQSSSPDYLGLSQGKLSHKMATYGHNKQANRPSSGHESQPAARNEPSSSAKRRRSNNAVEDMASKKRGKPTREEPVLQFEIPESQSQDVSSQRITESSAQRVSETQTQQSQTQSRSAIAPASRGRMISMAGASPGATSQSRPGSSEHVSQSRARTSSTRSTTASNRGKGRTATGRNHATRYDLRFNQELDSR